MPKAMTVSVAEGRRDRTRRPAPEAAVAGSMAGNASAAWLPPLLLCRLPTGCPGH